MRATRTTSSGLWFLTILIVGWLPAAAQNSPLTQEGVPRFNHVFLIIGENTTYDHLDSTNAPYLMGTIRPNAAWLTQYYAATHWSQANYVALVSGQFTGCEQKDYGVLCHQNVENLFHQLDVAGLTWKTWLEGGTAKCDTGSGGSCSSVTTCPLTGFYTTGNPAINFDNIEGTNGVWSATNPSQECLQNDLPAGDGTDPMDFFNQALAKGEVANFNLIIPNGCEDGEANCGPVHNRYTQFDNFLAREVPLIEQSPAFEPDDVIIVVYDEDERTGGLAQKNGFGEGGHVVCAILSPLAIPGDSNGFFYHYSLLRTLEDGFGLPNYAGLCERRDTNRWDLVLEAGRPPPDHARITMISRPLSFGRQPNALIGGFMKLTPGKLAGLQRVSDKRGVIAAAAMDQRGSLQKSLAKEKGGDVSDAMMEEFKSLVTEVLTPHASAILLDPEWGLPASKRRAKNAGLLLAYEKTGYDKTGPGRLGDLLDHWSARRLKDAGADCVKILLYYTPFDPKDVNDKKHAWVERIGDECRANDIPYFLEFVGYDEGADEKGLEYAKKKPHIVTESMREFSKDRYGVDVLKVEVPVNMKFVEGTKSYGGQKAYTKKEAIDLFHAAANVATKPFIYLSAGVSNAEFSETLELCGESGVKYNGVLCGRATWKEGIPIYAKQGAAAFRTWLETEGVKNINNVNEKLKTATSWFPLYDVEPVLA